VAGISENDVRHSFLSGFVVNLGAYIGGMFFPDLIEIKMSFIPAFIVATLVLVLGIIINGKKNELEGN
jgi:hypothetical protein